VDTSRAVARILVELDLREGLAEALEIEIDCRNYVQDLDYGRYHSGARVVTHMDILPVIAF